MATQLTAADARYCTPLIPGHLVDRDTAVAHELAKSGMAGRAPRGMTRDDVIRQWVQAMRANIDFAQVIVTDSADEDDWIEWGEVHMDRAIALLTQPRTSDPIIGDDRVYAAARQDATDNGVLVAE